MCEINTNEINEYNSTVRGENVYYKKIQSPEKASTDLVKQTQDQVEELEEILHENLDKAAKRDTKISELNEISESLEKGDREVETPPVLITNCYYNRRRMFMQLFLAAILLIVLVIVLIFVIVLLIRAFLK